MKSKALAACFCAVFLLSGCSNVHVDNPFAQPSIEDTYVSQFRDVPIPAPMETVEKETLVTVGPDGGKYGIEAFTGRVDYVSLSNVMMQNMLRQGWQLRGSSVGVRSIQLYEKPPYFAAIFYRDGLVKVSMDIWLVNGVNADILSSLPAVSNSGSPSSLPQGSGKVSKLSE